MISFLLDSEALQAESRNSPHEAGQVVFLQSVLRPGMSVIEPGANRGVTAVAIARQISDRGHLHAFEPVPEFYLGLKANLLRIALGIQCGRAPYKLDPFCYL